MLAAASAAFAGPHARYEVVDVTQVGPDVVLADKDAGAADADGAPLDVVRAMTALHVLARRGGRWWVAARQNTLVPTAAG
ncbi:hypothetical protein [Pseudonocardia abyssalis]|uniref:SnoaL-like domain-containing protein n=1 Tax=Pseudonocardia abyssalis TaxID=2792008 RepID=A0ABS6UUJ2_9PSEU|nr:hypothetical protein [Pseudonocardia abyssalis]MBW0117259.1 hypothetical protein [Pseudonocardia abyssalis]MBW0135419.1 hypothetical protein [Pseudonocardia abyssalis]